MKTNIRIVLIVIVVLLLVLPFVLRAFLFVVDEREQAVVLQFGKPVAAYTEPGLKFKLPFVQQVVFLPKTYQFWIGEGPEVLVDVPTADGKKVEVTPWIIWRINDPVRFLQELRTMENAEARVRDFVRSEMRDVITANALAEVVRSSNRELTYTFQVEAMTEAPGYTEAETIGLRQPGSEREVKLGRQKLIERVKAAVREELARTESGSQQGRGIELVDVGIARVDFVERVREEAFKRLIAFLESIAAHYTAEGERRKQEILNRTHTEVQQIQGEGQQMAAKIRGEAEAQVIKMYADAIRQMGDFYDFLQTLQMFRETVDSNTRLVLTTDSRLFRLFKDLETGSVGQLPGAR